MTRPLTILRFLSLILLTTLLIAGCGMEDYEKNMIEAQKRVDRFDEENRLLDSMVNIDARMGKVRIGDQETLDSAPVAQVFFRPPRGIQPEVLDPSKLDVVRREILYRYTTKEGLAKPIVSQGDNTVIADVYLGFCTKFIGKNKEPKYPQEFADIGAFKERILADNLFTQADVQMKPVNPPDNKKLVEVPGKDPLTFLMWEGTQPLGKNAIRYLLYIYNGAEKGAVAIISRIVGPAESFKTNGPPGAVSPSIDMSLASLLLGLESDSATQAWAKRGPMAPPPPARAATPAK